MSSNESFLPHDVLSQSEWTSASPLAVRITAGLQWLEANSRKLGISTKELIKPESLVGLGILGVIIGGTLTYEVTQLSQGRVDLAFALRYARENILPSIIWLAPPNELIAIAVGRSPEIIKNLDPTYISQLSPNLAREMANTALNISQSQFLRWASTGVFSVSKVISLLNIGSEANRIYKSRILSGKEPFMRLMEVMSHRREHVIRLSGKSSDVTEFDLAHGEHLVPVFEDASKVEVLMNQYTHNGKYPKFWIVDDGEYSESEQWEGFEINPNWYVTTQDGKKVLLLEADASVGEQAFALGPESGNDVGIQEVSQGFAQLTKIANNNKLKPYMVVRTLLVDSTQVIGTSEDGKPFTLRDQNEILKDADILIDARAPLLQAILEWLIKTGLSDDKTVVFVTTNDTYFSTVKEALALFGYQVVRWSPHNNFSPQTRHLIYQNLTADTMNTVKSLIQEKLVDESMCCALIDRWIGLTKLEELKKDLKSDQIASICSAQIYSNLFKLVRMWTRLGFSPEQIQHELDNSFNSFISTETE